MASPPIANLRTKYHSALSRASTTRSASSSGAPTASRMRSTSASKSSPACCRNYSGPAPDTIDHAVVLAAVKDAAREWPEDGPSLTAAARAGIARVQVGTEGWCRSNKRMGPNTTEPQNRVKSPTRIHEEAIFIFALVLLLVLVLFLLLALAIAVFIGIVAVIVG